MVGSSIVADNDINLHAGEDINISSAATSTDEHSESYTSIEGLFSSGTFASTLGKQTEETTQNTAQVKQVESQVVSLGGNVTINADNDVNITASRVEAFDGDITLAGDNVNLYSAYDTVDDSYAYAFDQAGISGGISLGVVDTAMAAADAAKSASTTNNSRLQAVQTARALQNANNLMNDAQALSNGDYSAADNYEISISLGSSSASQSSETHQANALGSTIKAGNDVTIIARSDDERENSGNINSVGALIQSGVQYDADGESSTGEGSEENKGDITLIADNDINLTSAENFFESDSENKSDSAAVGLSLSTDNGLQIFVSASQTRGMVNQNDLQHLETELNANGNVSIQSGGDTTLNGGQIFGDKVTGNIGGNLNIISQQDEEHYYSEQESAGFRLGIGLYGSPSSFSMNYSKMEADSDYVAVQEQSGIYAGDGGFDITVGGETKLQGGAIVGSNPDNNVLNTGSLSWDQLENHAEFDIESMSIGVSLSTSGGNANSATGGYSSDDGSASSTTYSVLSEGAIVVRDNPDFSRDNLKTSTDEAHQGLERIFATDQVQYVQDEAAFQQVVGQQMPKIIGDYAKSQTDHAKYLEEQADLLDENNPEQAQALRDEATEINGKWGENGTHRIALHTATGLISGDLSGAAGSLAVAASTPLLADALQDMGVDGPLRDTILLASSAAIGGAADGGTGAFSGAGQTLNNYLDHEESELKNNLKEQLQSCKTNGNCDQAKQDQLQGQINELEALDEARDLALLQASTEPQSETFQNLLGDANDAANTYEDAGILGDPENFAPGVHQDYASASSQAEMYSHQADSPTIFNLFYSTGMAGANIVEGLVSDILGGFNDINDISNIADLQNKAASGDQEAQQELQNILDEGVEDTGITWPWESAQALWDEAQDTANTADQYSENGQPDRATQTWGEFAASVVLGIFGKGKGKGKGPDNDTGSGGNNAGSGNNSVADGGSSSDESTGTDLDITDQSGSSTPNTNTDSSSESVSQNGGSSESGSSGGNATNNNVTSTTSNIDPVPPEQAAFPPGSIGAGKVWTKTGRLKDAQLPREGKIRFVPPDNWDGSTPLPRGSKKGYLDKFGNEWTKGPSRTQGQAFEWDVQLSPTGKNQIGWTTRDGSHANVSLDGKITHK